MPRVTNAAYYAEAALEFLRLDLSDGRRLLIPREELSELKNATVEQAKDLFINPVGNGIWWPQLDDGLYLPDFLQYRWRNAREEVAA